MKDDIQPLTPGQRDIMAKLEENTPQLTEADIGAAIRLAAVWAKRSAPRRKKSNDKVSDGGPLTHELKQDANPPFAAPLG